MSVGLSPSPVRIPCKVIATSNLTLSGAQTIDSVSCVVGDIVGCVAQSSTFNGAYLVQSGAWLPIDPGIGTGLELYARSGSSNVNKVYGCDTTGAITWGSSAASFTLKSSSGAAFNPAIPGAIGGTTPAAITGTVITATNDLVLQNIVAPSPIASSAVIFTGAGNDLSLVAPGGNRFNSQIEGASNTANVRKRYITASIASAGTLNVSLSGTSLGGHGTITAAGATGSVSGSFSFAANAATTLNGLTYTSFVATATASKLSVEANAGALRITNNLVGTQTIVLELTELLAV